MSRQPTLSSRPKKLANAFKFDKDSLTITAISAGVGAVGVGLLYAYVNSLVKKHKQQRGRVQKVKGRPQITIASKTPFVYPPSAVTYENTGGVSCSDIQTNGATLCETNPNNPWLGCVSCRENGFQCIRVTDKLVVKNEDGSRTVIQPNSVDNPTEGTCLPKPNNDLEVANQYVARPVLAKIDEVFTFTVECKYPSIFGQSDYLSDCDIYKNPCQPNGYLYQKSTGRRFNPSSGERVFFDPYLDGACGSDDKNYIGGFAEGFGPNLVPATFRNVPEDYVNVPDTVKKSDNYVDTGELQQMLDSGVKPRVARFLMNEKKTFIPKPCRVDHLTGDESSSNYYDKDTKQCVCDESSGWIGTYMSDDSEEGGNFVDVDTQNPLYAPINGCLHIHNVTQDYNSFVGGWVNSDYSSEFLKHYNFDSLEYPPLGNAPSLYSKIKEQGAALYLMPKTKLTLLQKIFKRKQKIRYYRAYCNRACEICLHYDCDRGNVNMDPDDIACYRLGDQTGSTDRIVEINQILRWVTCRDTSSKKDSPTYDTIVVNPLASTKNKWNTGKITNTPDPNVVMFQRLGDDGVKGKFLYPISL